MPWTLEEMEAAIVKGSQMSVLQLDAPSQLQVEVAQKEETGAVRMVLWEDLEKAPPTQLKPHLLL
jgi:hypothetical protein